MLGLYWDNIGVMENWKLLRLHKIYLDNCEALAIKNLPGVRPVKGAGWDCWPADPENCGHKQGRLFDMACVDKDPSCGRPNYTSKSEEPVAST